MALGMFGDVDDQSDDGDLQSAPPYKTRFGEGGWIDGSNHCLRAGERRVYARKQFVEAGSGRHLRCQRRQLRFVQLLAFQLSGQPIHAACDVP
jgi:hypothetical protein